MAKSVKRYDSSKVQELVDRAKEGDTQARDQLIMQFQILIISLTKVCTTGQYNPAPWSRQVQFLKLFTGKDLKAMAFQLKKQLSMYDIDEIRAVGNEAAVQAITKSKTNYTSTLVICFAELIKDMIKDGKIAHMDESHMSQLVDYIDEDAIMFNVFMQKLTEEEWIWARQVLDGEKPKTPPPPSLVEKVRELREDL